MRLCIWCAAASAQGPAAAQAVLAGPARLDGVTVGADASGYPPLRNNSGDSLHAKLKRPASVLNQPYQPIKKQDDQAQIAEIEMFVGESRVFPTPRVARIAVGNGQIMTATALDNKEVIVFANGVGTSSLFVWNEDGRYQRVKINIVPGDTTRYAREIAAFLTAIPNAKASVIGDKVIVEGDNLADLDIAKIEELSKRYPQIVNFTNRLGWEQMVIMDVKVVEFPINELREIGLKWAAAGGAVVGGIWGPIRRGNNANYQTNLQSGSAPPITGAGGSNAFVIPTGLHVMSLLDLGLNAQLNLLAQNGSASILAEPQLSARNGAKATFLAGGEYPYTVSTINGPTVMFKPYGIRLDIQPRVDRNGIIRATIESEVSAIDMSIATIAGPALSTRKTTTEFNVRSGETLVLSGLLSRKTSTSIDKVPLLGDIPVLGALFRSKRFQNDETELVVFVTPTVVDSHSRGLADRVEKTTERLQRDLGRPPFLSDPIQPDHDPAGVNEGSPRSGTPPAVRSGTAAQRAPLPIEISAGPVAAAVVHPLERGSTLQVTADGVVLRAAPNTASAALMELGRGAAVHMTEVEPYRRGSLTWRNVRVGDLQGWLPGSAVEPVRAQPAQTADGRGAAAQRDLQRMRVGLRNPQSRVEALEPRSLTANAPAASANMPLERMRVTLNRLAMRASPDINAPVVAQLRDGDTVEALPQEPQGYWLAVQAGDKRGWAPAQWLIHQP